MVNLFKELRWKFFLYFYLRKNQQYLYLMRLLSEDKLRINKIVSTLHREISITWMGYSELTTLVQYLPPSILNRIYAEYEKSIYNIDLPLLTLPKLRKSLNSHLLNYSIDDSINSIYDVFRKNLNHTNVRTVKYDLTEICNKIFEKFKCPSKLNVYYGDIHLKSEYMVIGDLDQIKLCYGTFKLIDLKNDKYFLVLDTSDNFDNSINKLPKNYSISNKASISLNKIIID